MCHPFWLSTERVQALQPEHGYCRCALGILGSGLRALDGQFGQTASVVLAAVPVCHVGLASVVLAAIPVAQRCDPFLTQLGTKHTRPGWGLEGVCDADECSFVPTHEGTFGLTCLSSILGIS